LVNLWRNQGIGTIADIIEGIEYAVKMGAKIITTNFTYPQNCTLVLPSLAERDAIKWAGEQGSFVCFCSRKLRM